MPETGADADAPTEPESAFAAVLEPLRTAIVDRGFQQLTLVQSAVLSADDGVRDLQISSQTGSGKTVALGFVLAKQLLADSAPRQPNTLVIVPTRELAMQVKDELTWLFAGVADLRIECVTGGTSISQERLRLRRHPAVVVGTPGRLLDHIRSRALDGSGVTQLVLDEADQMLDLGFRDDLEAILEGMPEDRRTHLVSATFPDEVRALTKKFQRAALPVEGTALGSVHADITHVAHVVHPRQRYAALVNLLLMAGAERTLVFVRTRADTAELSDQLCADGFSAVPISGDLAQNQRTRTLAAFRRGAVSTLVATDVAARGLDINDVTTVVHMDPPMDTDTYTHRSGRTGRAGQKGTSVLLVPKTRENSLRRMLTRAGVPIRFEPVPGAAVVQARQQQRQVERVRELLAGAQPGPEQRQLAKELLQSQDAQELVAGLLSTFAKSGPREPFAFDGPSPARPSRDSAHREVPASPAPHAHRPAAKPHRVAKVLELEQEVGGAALQPEPAKPTRRRISSPTGFVSFEINWGRLNGADVKRILAHVCRRGGIESLHVGAIELHGRSSTFEVAVDQAEEFARRVQRRDPRDPQLVITPAEGAPPRSTRSVRPAPARARPARVTPTRPWTRRGGMTRKG